MYRRSSGGALNPQLSSNMELHWMVSFSASCLHAAEAIAHGQLIADARMAEAVAEPAQVLRRDCCRRTSTSDLLATSPGTLGGHTMATVSWLNVALRKTVGARTVRHAGQRDWPAAIAEVEAAVRHAFPPYVDDLTLRLDRYANNGKSRARAAADHGAMDRSASNRSESQVVLVHPSLGGGGSAHLPYNNVLIEAVLANPVPELPEWSATGLAARTAEPGSARLQ